MHRSLEQTLLRGAYPGTSPYKRLLERYTSEYIFDTGGELRMTRQEAITEYELANFHALRNLESVLRALKVKTVRQLSKIDPASLWNTERVGYVTMYAAMCILHYHGYSVADWWGWKTQKKHKKDKQPVRARSNGHV